jgi:hypothetical protein
MVVAHKALPKTLEKGRHIMKPLRTATLFLITCLAITPLHAETTLPAPDNREAWNRLVDLFAECSAVYNLAATLKEAPDKSSTTYRELANNALIAGIYSAQRLGLSDSYLESIYSVKFGVWQTTANDKSQSGKILNKADQCLSDTLAIQNELLGNLRTHK